MTVPNADYQTLLAWLIEEQDPAVRHLTLRDLLDRPDDDAELLAARRAAHQEGPIPIVLSKMKEEGWWAKPGSGYSPKYRSTVWSVTLLGQLGAHAAEDERIGLACEYLLNHILTDDGQITMNGRLSGRIDCLEGNLCAALVDLGCEDPRLEKAFEWMARGVTGEGIAPRTEKRAPVRYLASGSCAPMFACSANDKLPCGWGAAKVMLAFSKWPATRRTPVIERAIEQGIDFLFSVDPAEAAYPAGYAEKPNRSWWQFGFPVFYVTDVLQVAEALAGLGYAKDPRLANAVDLIAGKAGLDGRWLKEYSYEGKTWLKFGEKKQPSKWVTLRALRVMKAAGRLN